MSGYELTCWQVLEQIDPWGPRRADYRAAVICWVVACCHYGGKGQKPQLKNFLKLFDFEPPKEQSDEEIAMLFDQIAAFGKNRGQKTEDRRRKNTKS